MSFSNNDNQNKKAADYGRPLPEIDVGFVCNDPHIIRQRVLLETLSAFEDQQPANRYHQLAASNLQRWKRNRSPSSSIENNNNKDNNSTTSCKVLVRPGDWGVVTSDLTKEYGTTFAVLNMANAYVPGGGYTEGYPAQEENMFRRTDCHYSINRQTDTVVPRQHDGDVQYTTEKTDLLNGKHGRVYLDVDSPRVCIRGPEDRNDRKRLGYERLPDEEVFSFYELRSAAVDLRGRRVVAFDGPEMQRRIAAQLETLKNAGIRHAVLSAFGCGAFLNPTDSVAALYREELQTRRADFDVVAFAIFRPGYGPDNFAPFRKAFEEFNP